MRYKLLVCALVLLISTPALSQEFSPIVIKTGKPTPSVIRSGEPFKVTYRAEFFDTVIIYEEQMQPDSLALDKVEVIGLNVVKERISNDSLGFVNVWDFTYTFRVIQPQKGVYKIPSFNFIWVDKKAGVTIEEAKIKEKPREMATDEVGVSYVTSIVKPPPLDIRDEIIFVSPVASGTALRRWAYGVIGFSSFVFVVILFRFVRYSKALQNQEVNRESDTETIEDVTGNTELILSPKQARRKFLKELKKLQSEAQYPTLDLEKKIRLSVRLLLLAELRGTIRASMSANEIYAKLSSFDAKQKKQMRPRYDYVINLAQKLKGYQEEIDSGIYFPNLRVEIDELEADVSGLKFHKRALFFVKRLMGER